MLEKPAPLVPLGTVKKSSRFLLRMGALIVLFMGAVVYARYFLPGLCDATAVEEASAMLVIQMKRYDDVYASATNGTRTSIEYPVAVLQQILMDTKQVAVPACMRTAKNELIGYMGVVIRAFESYRAGESDGTVKDLVDRSYMHLGTFLAEVKTIEQCAPYCLPRLR